MNPSKRRMSADLLKVGLNRVKFDPEQLDRVEEAVTREDLRRLIHSGVIWAEQTKGISTGQEERPEGYEEAEGEGRRLEEGEQDRAHAQEGQVGRAGPGAEGISETSQAPRRASAGPD